MMYKCDVVQNAPRESSRRRTSRAPLQDGGVAFRAASKLAPTTYARCATIRVRSRARLR